MSLSIDQLNAVTERYFVKKVFDNIFDSTPLLRKMKNTGSYKSADGGSEIYVPLNYAQASSKGWYSGSDTLSTSDTSNISSAVFQWRSLFAGIAITEEDKLKNAGQAQQVNLLKSKIQIAEKTLKNDLDVGIYSDGTDSKSIVGLRSIVGTANTVGGISQSDNSFWRAQVDSSTTTLTIAAMNQVFQDCTIDSEQPNYIVTTRSVYNDYYGLLQANQRFMDESEARGGFSSLMFNGQPCVHGGNVPTGHMYFLNLDHLHLFYHPERNISFQPFAKPINQEVSVSRFLWMGALGSSNNRLQGALTNIS